MTIVTPFTLAGLDTAYVSSTLPVFDGSRLVWACQDANGEDFNVVDLTGEQFALSGVFYAPLTALAFYLAFRTQERIDIKAAIDPFIKEFWDTYLLVAQQQSTIDPTLDSVVEGLEYLTTVDVPGSSPVRKYLAPARIPQIQAGTPQ